MIRLYLFLLGLAISGCLTNPEKEIQVIENKEVQVIENNVGEFKNSKSITMDEICQFASGVVGGNHYLDIGDVDKWEVYEEKLHHNIFSMGAEDVVLGIDSIKQQSFGSQNGGTLFAGKGLQFACFPDQPKTYTVYY